MEGSLVAYKVFTNGSVLQASEVNDNLMNQAVITFTNSTARASAITSPVEGMVTYLADTDTYQFWNGSAWTNLVSSTVGTGNAIINGAFEINQRNFSTTGVSGTYGFDRWVVASNATNSATYSAQTFTPGAAPVAGYEARNFARVVSTSQSNASDYAEISQPIEDVRSFAGQTVTVSFWAKAATGTPNFGISFEQNFGSGGSSFVLTSAPVIVLSTSWTRYTATISVPSISGKTIGTNSFLKLHLMSSVGTGLSSLGFPAVGLQNITADIWGVQVEAGTTATAFRRNANSLQGELAACQRYYYRSTPGNTQGMYGTGLGFATTGAFILVNLPVTMRGLPSSVDFSTLRVTDSVTNTTVTTLTITSGNTTTNNTVCVDANVASGLTQFRPYILQNGNSTAGFIGFSAEL
jgi:hypothetical protein